MTVRPTGYQAPYFRPAYNPCTSFRPGECAWAGNRFFNSFGNTYCVPGGGRFNRAFYQPLSYGPPVTRNKAFNCFLDVCWGLGNFAAGWNAVRYPGTYCYPNSYALAPWQGAYQFTPNPILQRAFQPTAPQPDDPDSAQQVDATPQRSSSQRPPNPFTATATPKAVRTDTGSGASTSVSKDGSQDS